MSSIEVRLARLERDARRWRAVACLLTLAAIAGVSLGTAPPPAAALADSDVVRARRFEVVDEQGRAWLVLARTANAGSLAVLDSSGRLLVTLSGTPDGSGMLALGNSAGKRLVEIAGKPGEGVGVLNVFADGTDVGVSVLAAEGAGIVQTFSGGKPTTMVGGVKGAGVIAVFDEKGKLKESFPAAR